MHLADTCALAARLGWMPSYLSFDRNPLDLADDAVGRGDAVADYVPRDTRRGPAAPPPRTLTGPATSPRC